MNASLRTFPSVVGTLWLLGCAPPLRARSTAAAEESGAVSPPRQEELAADALMDGGKPREALGELERAAIPTREAAIAWRWLA